MSDGGKGSKPRPYSVTQDEYENRWNAIFQRDDVVSKSEAKRLATLDMANEDNTGVMQNEYQDVLSTEDCAIDALEAYKKQAQELWNDSCTSHRKK